MLERTPDLKEQIDRFLSSHPSSSPAIEILWAREHITKNELGAACNNIGVYLDKIHKREEPETHEWFRRGALQRDARAMWGLAEGFRQGLGCQCDTEEAIYWYLEAWEHWPKNDDAQLIKDRKEIENTLKTLIDKVKHDLQNKKQIKYSLSKLIIILNVAEDITLFKQILEYFKGKRETDSIKKLYNLAVRIKNSELISACFITLSEDPLLSLTAKVELANHVQSECKDQAVVDRCRLISTVESHQNEPADGLLMILSSYNSPKLGDKFLPMLFEAIKNWINKFGSAEEFAKKDKIARNNFFREIADRLHVNPLASLIKTELIAKWKESSIILAETLALEFSECEQSIDHPTPEHTSQVVVEQYLFRSNLVYRLHSASPEEKSMFVNVYGESPEKFTKATEEFKTDWAPIELNPKVELLNNREMVLQAIKQKSAKVSEFAWLDDLFALNHKLSITANIVGQVCLSLKILLLSKTTDRFQMPEDASNDMQLKAITVLKNATQIKTHSLEDEIIKQFATFASKLIKNPAIAKIMQDPAHTDTVIAAAIFQHFGKGTVNQKNLLKFYKNGIKFAYASPNFDEERIDEIGNLLYPKPLAQITVGTLSQSTMTFHGQTVVVPVAATKEEKKAEIRPQ